MTRLLPAALCALLLWPWPARAADPADLDTVTLYLENDVFTGTDRHYTNAVKGTWLSQDLNRLEEDGRLPDWAVHLMEELPWARDPDRLLNVGLSIGQDIYTPSNTETQALVEDDRPYAGWLYFATALHTKTADTLDSFELSLGVVGPSAKAELAQNTVHRYKGVDQSEGWGNQLHDEPGVILAWQHHDRFHKPGLLPKVGADVIPHYGLAVGNVLTYLNLGAQARLGWNLPADFGASFIQPAGGVGARAPGQEVDLTGLDSLGFHVFAGVDGRAVARNIFLDGNTVRESHCVTRIPFVADVSTGASLHWSAARLTFAYVWRTQEFVEQESQGQSFGSLSLSVSF